MAKDVYVVNLAREDYTEEFKGKVITIPGRGKIKMNRREAINFLGIVPPTVAGKKMVEKALDMEPIEEEEESLSPEKEKYICHVDGKEFSNKTDLDNHMAELRKSGAVTPLKEEGVTCPICGKAGLNGSVGLRVHLTREHKE